MPLITHAAPPVPQRQGPSRAGPAVVASREVPKQGTEVMNLLGKCALLGFMATVAAAGAGEVPVQSGAPPPTAARPEKHILVLYDEDKDNFPGLGTTDRTLREAFHARLGKS